jgi:hypothetical protein
MLRDAVCSAGRRWDAHSRHCSKKPDYADTCLTVSLQKLPSENDTITSVKASLPERAGEAFDDTVIPQHG